MTGIGGFSSSKILFYVFAVFAVYAIVGMTVNKSQNELEGLDAFPHIEYWREAPSYIRDGI